MSSAQAEPETDAETPELLDCECFVTGDCGQFLHHGLNAHQDHLLFAKVEPILHRRKEIALDKPVPAKGGPGRNA
tara:strand:+ start:144 stop:368 length:225 start_codon:yes stop_codon:yes gene_type:complete